MASKQMVKVYARNIETQTFYSASKALEYLAENGIKLHGQQLTRLKQRTDGQIVNYSGVIFEYLTHEQTLNFLRSKKYKCTQCGCELGYNEYKTENSMMPKMPCKQCLANNSKMRRESKKARILHLLDRLDAISDIPEQAKNAIFDIKNEIIREVKKK